MVRLGEKTVGTNNFFSEKIAKCNDDAKRKHAFMNEGHLVALALKDKWLELHEEKSAEDWDQNALRDMNYVGGIPSRNKFPTSRKILLHNLHPK